MGNRLLFIDTETGGINPQKHSLLSLGVVVWDSEKGGIFKNEYFIYSEHYSVTASAAKINHFNEAIHNGKARDPRQVIDELWQIKESYFTNYASIPLAGHNIAFDSQFLKHFFLSNGRSYEKLFSHRLVDTYSIIKFLVDCSLLPVHVNSSASAFKHFGIQVVDRHSAIGDAFATMQLYVKLLSMIRENKENGWN